MDMFRYLGVVFFLRVRLYFSVRLVAGMIGGLNTETIKIIAPCSRESSLQALVKIGSPTGTNAYPGYLSRGWLVT